MVVLNTTDVIYFWPHVDFMALFCLFRGGEFKKPSVICQSFEFAVEEGDPFYDRRGIYLLNCQIKKKKKTCFVLYNKYLLSKLP